jgi:hypothetical protein
VFALEGQLCVNGGGAGAAAADAGLLADLLATASARFVDSDRLGVVDGVVTGAAGAGAAGFGDVSPTTASVS